MKEERMCSMDGKESGQGRECGAVEVRACG